MRLDISQRPDVPSPPEPWPGPRPSQPVPPDPPPTDPFPSEPEPTPPIPPAPPEWAIRARSPRLRYSCDRRARKPLRWIAGNAALP
jgi:hypothetical protein